MTKHAARLAPAILLMAAWMAVCAPNGMLQTSAAQETSAPSVQFHFPQATLSSRTKHDGPGMIDVHLDGDPVAILLAIHGTQDLLQNTQITNRSKQGIASVRMGWAYVLANGPEYHAGDVYTLRNIAGAGETFTVPEQSVTPRPQAKDFLTFVEQVTMKDGTVWNADHAKIGEFYKACCTDEGRAKAKAAAAAAAVANVAAAGPRTGPQVTPGLKPISFDVVSFRRTKEYGSTKVDMPVEGDYIAYHGVPLERLILFAHIAPKGYTSISGEPDWAKTDLYEFQAKVAAEDVSEWHQMTLTDKRAMVATLLADVLKLKVHQDTEPHLVYELVAMKGGPKLTEWQAGDTVKAPGGQVLTGKVLRWFDPFTLVCQDTTMAELVNSLSGPERVGRVVIDKTGLTGVYNFTVPIPYAPIPAQFQQMQEDAVPSTFDGLKSLGLKLVSAKDPVDAIVVDHIERPEEN